MNNEVVVNKDGVDVAISVVDRSSIPLELEQAFEEFKKEGGRVAFKGFEMKGRPSKYVAIRTSTEQV